MENKYITVAYKLYAITDGGKRIARRSSCRTSLPVHLRNRIYSGKIRKEILALNKGDDFNFTIPCAEAYGEGDEGKRTRGSKVYVLRSGREF